VRAIETRVASNEMAQDVARKATNASERTDVDKITNRFNVFHHRLIPLSEFVPCVIKGLLLCYNLLLFLKGQK
jgi:hypothetical protein